MVLYILLVLSIAFFAVFGFYRFVLKKPPVPPSSTGLSLYLFSELGQLPDASPFCNKLEAFLRVANVPFEAIPLSRSLQVSAPSGKRPFVSLNGEIIADSSVIIEKIQDRYQELMSAAGRPPALKPDTQGHFHLDASLNDAQRGISRAFCRMLQESTYWVVVHDRWVEDSNWVLYFPIIASGIAIPSCFKWPLFNFIVRRSIRQTLWAQGTGRLPRARVYEDGSRDFQALSDLLGSDAFFFGQPFPTMLDIVAYSFVSAFSMAPFSSPVKEHLQAHCRNLVAHSQRLLEFQNQ